MSCLALAIRAWPGAQKTNAYQSNRNLLLSKKARADSLPQLEIEANDLRCTHGATVSQVDEDLVFYLMSRGIPRADAVRLIVEHMDTREALIAFHIRDRGLGAVMGIGQEILEVLDETLALLER